MLSSLLITIATCGLVLKSVEAASATVDLTNFVSGSGMRLVRSVGTSRAGYDVAFVGDFNKDGYADFTTGAYQGSIAVVIMGRPTTTPFEAIDFATVVSGQYVQKVSMAGSTWLGITTGAAGDINNDGYDDVIIGAGASTTARAFVLFGKVGPFTDITYTTSWSTYSVGVSITGPTSVNFVRYPRTARGLGDVDGDGYDDFAVTAYQGGGTAARANAGSMWLFFGTGGNPTANYATASLGNTGILFGGEVAGDNFGYSLNGNPGDFNGDGKMDILVGAVTYNAVVNSVARISAGAVYMIFGSSTIRNTASNDMLSFTTGAQGVRFMGGSTNEKLGSALSFVGDLNGDGFDEIALGGPGASAASRTSAGKVYIIYGTNAAFTADVDMLNWPATSLGFAIYGSGSSQYLATAALAGDVDQDGFKDLIVGGTSTSGKVHIIYGTGAKPTVNIDTAAGKVTTFILPSGSNLGWAIDGNHDVNGDGKPDLLLSAYAQTVTLEGTSTSVSSSGAAYMLPGPFLVPSDPPTATPTSAVVDPTTDPTRSPTAAPTTAAPSGDPSASPSAVPSAVPSAAPSEIPSASPSAVPSEVPSEVPSAVPSATPSAYPTAVPTYTVTASPTAVEPTVTPTVTPSAVPSAVPSAAPSEVPSAGPSAVPSALPSAAPSAVPSAAPTVVPSAAPSAIPSPVPSAAPSVAPSTAPSATPSVAPSAVPSVVPSAAPSAVPTFNPSAVPSVVPSAVPSALPTFAPSAEPTMDPTAAPSADPTLSPTASPTVDPTLAPSADPTVVPTAAPSAAPTVRPTVASAKNMEVKVTVQQTVYFMTEENYNAQKVEYNRTIQATVAASMDGVTPDRVTDIVVAAASTSSRGTGVRGGSSVSSHAGPAVDQCSLKYTVRVTDPVLTFDVLRDQLSSSAATGQMDTDLRHYATVYGATKLANGTFAEPQVSNAAVMRAGSVQLTGAQIAGLVIGIVLCIVLLATLVLFVLHVKKGPPTQKESQV